MPKETGKSLSKDLLRKVTIMYLFQTVYPKLNSLWIWTLVCYLADFVKDT